MIRPLTGPRICIDARLPLAPLDIHVDRGHFDAAIIKLALSARDAMSGDGGLIVEDSAAVEIPRLRSRARVVGDYVAVAIADTGNGIPAEMFECIFEPFFSTKSVSRGTAPGLSQVLGFVNQSGGELSVESEMGRGSTFTLYLHPRDAIRRKRRSEPSENPYLNASMRFPLSPAATSGSRGPAANRWTPPR